MANLFPIMLCLDHKDCLVVGGGEVATRKVEDLLASGARVKVVAPQASADIARWAAQGSIHYQPRGFENADVVGMTLVISATDDETVNQQVMAECRKHGIMVNVVDDPSKCDFFIPAVARQGSLLIAVSTEGKSPLLARRIKNELQQNYGEEYDHFVDILGEARQIIKESITDIENRKRMFMDLVQGGLLEVIRNEGPERAREWMLDVYSSWRSKSPDDSTGD